MRVHVRLVHRKVALGSDNPGMIAPGRGTCIPDELRRAYALGLSRDELAELMATAFENSDAAPAPVRAKFAAEARAWAGTDEPIGTLPKADLHSHLNGALPQTWIERQAALQGLDPPQPFSSQGVQWTSLDDFRLAYDQRAAIIKAASADSIPDQVVAVAKDFGSSKHC